MKKTLYNILMTAMVVWTAMSCTGDLDQMPHTDTQVTGAEAYASAASYKMVLAKTYASYVIVGQEQGGGNEDMSSNNGQDFLRCYFNLQEDPTDEVASTWLSGDKVEGLTYMTWDANDPWVADAYYRLYYTIALSNEFLRHTDEGSISGFGEQDQKEILTYKAEARFLRALAYYYVLDLFGQGPYVDETMPVGAYTPERYSNKQLFDFIESELKDVATNGLAAPSAIEYGRASNAAAWGLLAKLYLNAEVYGAGNHYTECITACQKVMEGGFSLESDYAKLFNADNHKRTNEIIFPFVVDGENTVTWGATTLIVCGQCGNSSTQDPTKYGLTNGWGMFRVRGELPNLFDNVENPADSRCMFYTDSQTQWFTKGIDDQTQGYFSEKFTNLTDEGEAACNSGAVGVSTDFPVLRLADVYLMLAEAVLRGGQGATKADALGLVNQLRERAYGNANGNINDAQLNLDFILDERARELYLECSRRTDLVRYGKFTGSSYIWQWKGGILDGKATDAKYNIYPIPTAELSANPNLSNDNY